MSEEQDSSHTSVFLSYSRADAGFVRRLAAELEKRGYVPIFDASENPHDDPDLVLTAQDEWWDQLKRMIAAADVMVFVVTPDSARSRVCDDEIAHARGLGKRVIATLRRRIDFNTAPERLRALNVKLNFETDSEEDFSKSVSALSLELDRDINWHRQGAHFIRLARKWQLDGRPEGQLLRSGGLAEADAWALRRPRDADTPGDVLLEFLNASRSFEQAESKRQRRIIGRAFVKPALQALQDGISDKALRLAAAGALLSDDFQFELVPELWDAAAKATYSNRIRTTLVGHQGEVKVARFSPEGKRIVTASSDHTARIWDAESGKEIAQVKDQELRTASFSPDGRRIVTLAGTPRSPSASDNVARIWDAENGTEIAVLKGHERRLHDASFSPDGRRIVTASQDNTARIWDAETGAEIAVLKGHTDWVNNASFSPDGKRIVTCAGEMGATDTTGRVWDAENGAVIALLKGHGKVLYTASFSPDGKRVVTTSLDYTARIWDAETGKDIAVLKVPERKFFSASFSPDGKRIVTAVSDNTARVWDAENGREIAILKGHQGSVIAESFSPDGKRIVTASDDNSARIWDAESGTQITVLTGHERELNDATFSPDGLHILTASSDNTARIWDAQSRTEIAVKRHKSMLYDASFSPDGKQIVIVSQDKTARICSAEDGAEIAALTGHALPVLSASFSPDSKRIVTASTDKTARIWDAQSAKEIGRLPSHDVRSASFSPDGTRIVTTGSRTAHIWSIDDGREIAVLKGHHGPLCSASFSLDGRRIVTASFDKTARVWDAESGQEIAVLNGHEHWLNDASFSPDGRRIVTASSDTTARIWDTEKGTEIEVLKGHKDSVNGASFSSDGKRIVTASSDLTARVWDAESATESAVLIGHKNPVKSASFAPDGRRVLTCAGTGVEIGGEVRVYDNTARIWDVSRTECFSQPQHLLLAAALARGIGARTVDEAADLLMQDASGDLFDEVIKRVSPSDVAVLDATAAKMRAPLHPNCYLSLTQFAEKFGLDEPDARIRDLPNAHVEPSSASSDSSRGGSPFAHEAIGLTDPQPLADAPQRPIELKEENKPSRRTGTQLVRFIAILTVLAVGVVFAAWVGWFDPQEVFSHLGLS